MKGIQLVKITTLTEAISALQGDRRRNWRCPDMHAVIHLYVPAGRRGDLAAWIP